MQVNMLEAKTQLSKLVEAVLRGEEVVITYRGKATARIIRYKKTRDARVEKHALFGMWADNSQVADVDRYVRDLRKGRF